MNILEHNRSPHSDRTSVLVLKTIIALVILVALIGGGLYAKKYFTHEDQAQEKQSSEVADSALSQKDSENTSISNDDITFSVTSFQGTVVEIGENYIDATPLNTKDDPIDYGALFPKKVRITLSPSTSLESKTFISDASYAEVMDAYKKAIASLPPDTPPSKYPSYPNVVRSSKELTLQDFKVGDTFRASASREISGKSSFEATIITK